MEQGRAVSSGLADRLRERTRALHREAERSGIVRDVLQGRASRLGYALLLRNLLPAYQELERGLERHRNQPGVRVVAQPALYRSAALASDLDRLCGPAWNLSLPLLHAGTRYANRIATAAETDGARLIAHAYARYLGDLNGGQIMMRLLARSLGLGPECLAFYAFPGIDDLGRHAGAYRAAFDQAGPELSGVHEVVEEAALAFELNIEVSCAVQAEAAVRQAPAAGEAIPA